MHPLLASSIFTPIAKPIADVLAAFYAVIPNYGVAIMLLSVAWMLIIAPLTLKSTRSMLAMQKLQPELKRLQAEHKNDRQAFAQAQMDLFKEHGVSPFGSCLPSLLPLPIFFALFRVIDGLSHHSTVLVGGVKRTIATPSFLSPHTAMYKAIAAADGHINAFGLDLSKNALSGHSSLVAALPFYLLLLIMIGTQYLQTVQMMSRNKAAQDNPQMKFMKYLPIIFGVISVRFPAGVILYYATSNLCRIAQQSAMYRYDPKVRTLVNQEIIEVESHTKDYDRKQGNATPAQSRGLFARALAKASEAQEQAKTDPAKRAQAGGSKSGSVPKTTPAPSKRAGTAGGPQKAVAAKAAAMDQPGPNGKATKTNATAKANGAAKANGTARANGTAKSNGATKGPAASGGARSNGATANGAARPSGAAPADDGRAPASRVPAGDGQGETIGNGNGQGSPVAGGRTGAGRTGAQAGRNRKRRS